MDFNIFSPEQIIRQVNAGLKRHESEIMPIKLCSFEALQVLVENELKSNPSLFFVCGMKYRYTMFSVTLIPMYRYDEITANRLAAECSDAAEKILSRITAADDYQKALQLHNILSANVMYADDYNAENHTMVGVFKHRKAVCSGFAFAYKYLLDRVGITNRIVYGTSRDPSSNQTVDHAWNMAMINGKWHHIDVTFDTTLRVMNIMRHDYFCISDERILRDHSFDAKAYPPAESDGRTYYERCGLLAEHRSRIDDIVTSCLRRNQRDIVFQLPDYAPETGIEENVSRRLEGLLQKLGISCSYVISCNPKQRVVCIRLEK